jgi:hypothetical protein
MSGFAERATHPYPQTLKASEEQAAACHQGSACGPRGSTPLFAKDAIREKRGILCRMTTLLQDAIQRLKELPDERQNELAEALMAVAESDLHPYHLTDDQVAEVRRRRANPNRKFVSLAQVRKRLRHFGA